MRFAKVFSSLSVILLSSAAAFASDLNDFSLRGADLPSMSQADLGLGQGFELGTRLWVSSGSIGDGLYDIPGSGEGEVSRLTWRNLGAISGELYGRTPIYGSTFLKGEAGLGAITRGSLQDEDFEPLTDPYSSTKSGQHGGALDYANIDYGIDFLQQRDYRLGVILGVNYLREKVNAYGCTQTATNPDICFPGEVAAGALAITENTQWLSPRLGVSGKVLLMDRLRLGGEAAWLPYTRFFGLDTHWLRTDIGPIKELGSGHNGFQLQTTLDYDFTDSFSVGAGFRYWRMTANPDAKFVDLSGTELSVQPESFSTKRYGTFIEASYRF